MTETVSPQTLLEGAAYALEQAGLLLRDAIKLYKAGAYPSAVVLATFGWEELGKWKMLCGLRRRVMEGESFTVKQVNNLCLDHEEKLSTAIAGIGLSDEESGGLVRELMNATPGSAEYAAVDEKIQRLFERRRAELPAERHKRRMAGLYVDALSATEWNRPTKTITNELAKKFLTEAINDYAQLGHQVYTESVELNLGIDDELTEALKNWKDRPVGLGPDWSFVQD
jgi:AbiV family abortive infection protein